MFAVRIGAQQCANEQHTCACRADYICQHRSCGKEANIYTRLGVQVAIQQDAARNREQ